MKSLTKLAYICMLMMCFGSLRAQQNPLIAMTGALKDANGAAVPDGNYSLVFHLYNEPQGGISKWTETAVLSVKGGLYNHLLGSVIPLTPPIFNQTQFLGVTIGEYEMEPRTELTYAPYTYQSFTAIFADKVLCSGAVGDIKYSTLAPAQFALVNGDCWIPMDGRSITGSKLSVGLGANNVPDVSGVFFRAHEYTDTYDPGRTPSTAVGTLQTDTFKEHKHDGSTSLAGGHSHSMPGLPYIGNPSSNTGSVSSVNVTASLNYSPPSLSRAGQTHTVTLNNSGGTETRPKNLNFYAYIRIN